MTETDIGTICGILGTIGGVAGACAGCYIGTYAWVKRVMAMKEFSDAKKFRHIMMLPKFAVLFAMLAAVEVGLIFSAEIWNPFEAGHGYAIAAVAAIFAPIQLAAIVRFNIRAERALKTAKISDWFPPLD